MRAIGRRQFLELAGAVTAMTAAGAASTATVPKTLTILDSRVAQSVEWAQSRDHAFDIARQDEQQWREIRALGGIRAVDGLTRWSDWTSLRGHFAERGLRVVREERIERRNGPTLFAWSMAAA